MTDRLIILNKVKEHAKEGFFKFDDNGIMTAAFSAPEGKYMWLAGNTTGEFFNTTHIHTHISSKNRPENFGIFLISRQGAHPVLFSGDLNTVKQDFEKLTGHSVSELPDKAPSASVSSDIKLVEAVPDSEGIEAQAEKEAPQTEEALQTEELQKEAVLTPPTKAPDTFWDCNEEEFMRLFNENPVDETMANLIPGSRWVHVQENDYMLGIIYDEEDLPMYLCYGFPLGWSEEPPEKLEGYCQWIPKNCASPHDDGYWVIYINAKTGERVR